MSDEPIAPALSESAWGDVAKYGVDYMRAECGPVSYWHGDDGFAAMLALANAALPSTDNRKLVKVDADAIEDIAREYPELNNYHRYVLRRVSTIIRALLPPRETP